MKILSITYKCPGCGYKRETPYDNARCWNCGW